MADVFQHRWKFRGSLTVDQTSPPDSSSSGCKVLRSTSTWLLLTIVCREFLQQSFTLFLVINLVWFLFSALGPPYDNLCCPICSTSSQPQPVMPPMVNDGVPPTQKETDRLSLNTHKRVFTLLTHTIAKLLAIGNHNSEIATLSTELTIKSHCCIHRIGLGNLRSHESR